MLRSVGSKDCSARPTRTSQLFLAVGHGTVRLARATHALFVRHRRSGSLPSSRPCGGRGRHARSRAPGHRRHVPAPGTGDRAGTSDRASAAERICRSLTLHGGLSGGPLTDLLQAVLRAFRDDRLRARWRPQGTPRLSVRDRRAMPTEVSTASRVGRRHHLARSGPAGGVTRGVRDHVRHLRRDVSSRAGGRVCAPGRLAGRLP